MALFQPHGPGPQLLPPLGTYIARPGCECSVDIVSTGRTPVCCHSQGSSVFVASWQSCSWPPCRNQYCTHWGTIQIGSITNASLRVRQWSGPASWCGIGVLAISSCLVWHLWMLAQSFFLGPSSWWFPHAFCRSWDPELRFILGISFLICFTQELIPGYVLYVQRLSLLFTPCLSDS